MHVQYILDLKKLQQNPTQAKDLCFFNTHLTWGVCELIEKNFSMHVRTTAGVFFTTACTATPPRHAHRASVATYMQQHQQQQQAASSATCYGACQEDLSTCGFLHNMYCMYLPRSGLHHHHHQSALNLHTAAAAAAPCVRTLDWR